MFTGSIVALVTPMDGKGKVCRSSLKELTDYHVTSDTSVIASVDTTGESATLSHDGHGGTVMMTLELADGRIPVVAGADANVTAKATSLTQRSNDSGVVGYLMVAPCYNRSTQEGLFQYFKVIAEHTDLPQILYNVPSCTGCDILSEIVGRLAKVRSIIATKETARNLNRVHQIKELVSDDSIPLSGNGAAGLDFMQLGGYGVIPATSNVAARDIVEMYKLAAVGQLAEVRVISQRLMPLHNKLFVEPNPIPVKWACKTLGLVTTDMLRLPMTPTTDNTREIVKATPKYTGLL